MRHLALLGPARVEHINTNPDGGKGDAGSIPRFRSQRAVGLLGYLASERRTVAREYLATLLWPDEPPAIGRSKLRRELYNLVKILPGCWETDAQTVGFYPGEETSVDIYLLGQMEDERRWLEAAEMLGGEFLEGLSLDDSSRFETWLLAEQERWRERSLAVLASARDELTRHGRFAQALGYGQRLLQLAPWDEAAHQQVMRLLTWTGRQEAAIRQFARCERMLAEHLAVEPSQATLELLRRIREGELAAPAKPPVFLAGGKARRPDSGSLFVAREHEMAWLNRALDSALAGRGGLVFLTGGPGRGKTALMDAFARQAIKAHPELLAAHGRCDAGAADPFLPFREVLAMLTGDVEGRWLAGDISREHARRLWGALPLVVQALLEHGPHLLHILLNGPMLLNRAAAAEPIGAPWLARLRDQVQGSQGETADLDRRYLFEQFASALRAVAEKKPLLLLLDDLQWASAASAGLLFHLGRRLPDSGSRILIVCAYRPEEIIRDIRGGRPLLAKILGEFRNTLDDAWLSLSWPDDEAGRRFVEAVIDSESNRLGHGFRDTLYQITHGHPLFTVELLRTMQDRGDLIRDEDGPWRAGLELNWAVLPARVEAVIEERIGRLEPELYELLAVASVEGESFTSEVLGRVQGVSQRQILGLLSRELDKHHRLVREREEASAGPNVLARFQFAHVLFQRYLYGSLSAGQRRLLHGEVGQALEALHEGQTEEKASQLAYHFLNAGRRQKAAEYSHLAARWAKATYAYDEAIQHLQTALDLLGSGERVEIQLDLLEDLADVHRLLTNKDQAISNYQRALDLWPTLAGPDEMIPMRLHRKILETLFIRWIETLEAQSQTLSASRSYLEAMLPLTQREQPQLEWVRMLTALANATDMGFMLSEDLDTAEGYARVAVEMAEQLDAPEELSDALEALAGVHFVRGRLPEQLAVSRRRLDISQDPRFGNQHKRVSILESLSDALIAVGNYAEAMHHLQEMEGLASVIKAIASHVWSLSLQALCLFRLDRWEELLSLEDKLRELERRYAGDQLVSGGNCVVLSISAAARALQGDLGQARPMREQAFAIMVSGTGGSTENWGRTQYY